MTLPSWLWTVDAIMAGAALLLLVPALHRRRKQISPHAWLLGVSLQMCLLVLSLGSIEAASVGARTGLRNIGVIIASSWVLFALSWNTPPIAWVRARVQQHHMAVEARRTRG